MLPLRLLTNLIRQHQVEPHVLAMFVRHHSAALGSHVLVHGAMQSAARRLELAFKNKKPVQLKTISIKLKTMSIQEIRTIIMADAEGNCEI